MDLFAKSIREVSKSNFHHVFTVGNLAIRDGWDCPRSHLERFTSLKLKMLASTR